MSSFIETPSDGRIESLGGLILLGFAFDERPTVAAHMDLVRRKFYGRSWLLRHLKQAGVPLSDIAKIYAAVIRSVIEYAAPVYGPMMSGVQSEELERLQRQSLKLIYGYRTSYSKALELAGLKSLSERRDDIMKKFAQKLTVKERFDQWLPKTGPDLHGLRKTKTYREEHANTDRLYKSPLFTIRRLLNEG